MRTSGGGAVTDQPETVTVEPEDGSSKINGKSIALAFISFGMGVICGGIIMFLLLYSITSPIIID
jgi:hypothetical protein